MPKRTRDYNSWRLEKLADPQIAEGYLNDALADSPQMFLKALLNVTQARQNVAAVATKAGVKRETIYRAFSKRGNPTLDTLNAVLSALGLQIRVAARAKAAVASLGSPTLLTGVYRAQRRKGLGKTTAESAGQLSLPFVGNEIASAQRVSPQVGSPSTGYVGIGELQAASATTFGLGALVSTHPPTPGGFSEEDRKLVNIILSGRRMVSIPPPAFQPR